MNHICILDGEEDVETLYPHDSQEEGWLQGTSGGANGNEGRICLTCKAFDKEGKGMGTRPMAIWSAHWLGFLGHWKTERILLEYWRLSQVRLARPDGRALVT